MQDTYRKKRTVSLELGTTNSDIYTCPDRYDGDVNSIIVSNATANDVTVSLDWYNNLNTTYYTIMEQVTLKPYSFVQLTEYPLYLRKSDKIRGLASVVSAITVTVAVEEHFNGAAF
jgi:hypothetical protein